MKNNTFVALLGLLILVMVVLAACTVFLAACTASPTATPLPTREAKAVPSITPEPTVTMTATPAPTSTSTSTPLPPQPPRLVHRSPERGEEHLPQAPLLFHFDRDMDARSVEEALRIEPEVEGEFSWDDASTLRFTPGDEGFLRDTTYHVTIDSAASSLQKLALARPVDLRFRTVGFLEITDVFPAPDSTNVSTESTIRVIFNRPVVPLTAIQSQTGLPDPVEFSPPAEGKGTWINTSIYSFEPAARLLPGTQYTARIRAGLEDVTSGLLDQDYVWSFATELPDVVSVRPKHKAEHVSPYTAIAVTFNQPMQHLPTQSRFTVVREQGGAPVRGMFSWKENIMIYTPSQPLDRGATYHVRLEKGSPAASGEAAIAKAYAWQFDVASLPKVLSIRPREGEDQVSLGRGVGITFSSPISRETFLAGFTITPTVGVYPYWQDGNTRVDVSTYLKPSTRYTVTLGEGILGRYGHRLQETEVVHFTTRPYDPRIYLNTPGRVGTYNAYAGPVVYVGHRNVSRVELALYTFSPENFIALNREGGWRLWEKYRTEQDELVRRWSQPARAPLNATHTLSTTLTQADGEALAPGFYYLEVTAPEVSAPQRHLLVVSSMNLTLKSTQSEALIWATDLRDGLPVPKVEISIYNAKGILVGETTTDGNGIALAELPQQDPWSPLIVLAQGPDGVSAVLRNWSRGISPWDFDLPGASVSEPYRAHFYTDRAIYRPGQKVYFKGILRADDDARYSLPPQNTTMGVTVLDSQGREFWQKAMPISDMGTLYGEFELGEEAPLGYYHLQALYEEHYFGVDFQVAEYRKPEFQVKVDLEKEEYIHGDTIEATAEATYFFGGPVANAQVRWRVMRSPFVFNRWQGKGYYSFSDYDYDLWSRLSTPFGEFLTEGEGVTDGQGRFTFSLPADIAERTQSQVYTIEVSVTDLNNQEVSARSAAVIHKGTFYIGLSATRYVGTTGQELPVEVITVDTQGITHTQQTLDVVFYRHEWYSVKEKADDGHYYWTNKVRDTALVTRTVTTDELGSARVSFVPPEGGIYKVLAKGFDEHENEVRSALYLWVSGYEFINWGQKNDDRIDLIADKKSYLPGETAQILIPSPYQGTTTALLTIERGSILEYKPLQLESNSEQLDLPILPEYAPNVFVSVVIVKGMGENNTLPTFKVGYVMLPVSTERKELRITITPDRSTHYQPRDEVTYQIEALDYQGQGVEAEISLQLVDLAVESLAGAGGGDIVQAFYRERGLGVQTATTLVNSVDRHNLEYAEEGKGGGGGPGESLVRHEFPDTAFWAPAVRTDASGRASVTVDLPDSLTTWRMTGQAVTAQTEVGKARTDIVSTLDVMIRPVTPRFMVIGDQPVLGAVVHNNTDKDLDMVVRLAAQGVTLDQGGRTLTVLAHGREAVSWPAVVDAVEEAMLQFEVVAGSYSDAIRLNLPVYHPSSPETVGTAGEVEDQVIELVRLPENADTSLGELTVNLEPSLAASMREGLKFLRTFPYDCIEQTVSRFLPNAVTYRALRELDIRNPELEASLPQQVGVGLQRLYALQNLDGGWGWWPNDASSSTLTAYVLFGLAEAQRAGFALDQDVMDRGIAYLYARLDVDAGGNTDWRATVLYALAEAGQGDLGRSVALFDQRAGLSLYSRAYLATTLHLLDPKEPSRPKTLLNELNDAAILSATGAHWEEKRVNRWAMNTDTRTTAIVLRTLVQLQPDNSLLPNAVRWLTMARKSGRWETTQENVWSILALTDYMVATGELLADYDYELWVNDTQQASGTVTTTTLDEPIHVEVPVGELRQDADNAIIMERRAGKGQEGTGKLYYSAFLRYFLPVEELRALNRGIIVERQYTLAGDPKKPISEATVNDVITVTLTLIAPNDLYFLVLEDPLPAGCEAIDTGLKTTAATAQGPEFTRKKEDKRARGYVWGWYRHWPSHTELRDEKVALFASYLRRGTYEYTYSMRCTTPGHFKVLPATAYEMYFADVFGRSAGGTLDIEPSD